ncbi:MAG: serine/threonine-protein kinase [Gammaproteobacteria bacterium]
MTKRAIPLMAWVIAGLLAISVIPFATTVFQISRNQDGLIDQVQQTHLVSVISTAETLSNYIAQLSNLLVSIGTSPSVIDNDDDASATELLANALLMNESIVAIGLYDDGESRLLRQMAQKKSAADIASAIFERASPKRLQTVTLNNQDYLILRHVNPNAALELLMLVDRAQLQSWLTVPALNDARLGLRDDNNQIIDGQVNDYRLFPESLRSLLDANYVGSAADDFTDDNKTRQVAAFARVADTDWAVISQQVAQKAEIARQAMWQTAVQALVAVFLLSCLLASAAHAKVVRPIRDILKSQRQLLGANSTTASGSEIDQLKQAFTLLETHIRDRRQLKKISLGRYQISDVIASGAMGTVFKGWDPRLERPIAIKTIRIGEQKESFKRDMLVEKLVAEAKLVAKIVHPNIVTIYDAVDTRETAFIAMELVEGISLRDYLKTCKAMAPMQTVALAAGILRGLAEAHTHGIIHRDIKGGNVLLGYSGSIKLSDFGLASIVGSAMSDGGSILGSPGYIAPEVIAGRPYTHASDIFSVGVLLYRCLVGFVPFRGPSVAAILNATTATKATPPMDVNADVPEPLSNAVMSLLIKDPMKRPSSALLVIDTIERALGTHAWQPTFADDSNPPVRAETVLPSTMILPDTLVQKHLRTPDD